MIGLKLGGLVLKSRIFAASHMMFSPPRILVFGTPYTVFSLFDLLQGSD